MKKSQKLILIILSSIVISISVIAPLQMKVQAIFNIDQGTSGAPLFWGPNRYGCGYSAINVGIGSYDASVIQKGKGGLVDIRGNLLELNLGFSTTLSDSYDNLEDLISIKVNLAVYDHTLGEYKSSASVFARNTLRHDNAHIHEWGTYYANVWAAAGFIVGRINAPAGFVMKVIGYFKVEGGISTTFGSDYRSAIWRAGAGPPCYVEHWDHKEIMWSGTLGSLDPSDSHSYEVKIRVDVVHTGNIGYYTDSIYYNFFLNKITSTGGGGGGGSLPPLRTIC